MEQLANKLVETWPTRQHDQDLVQYLEETVSPNWSLLDCIKRGVAFHHGAMPRHIQDLIVDNFNDVSENGINYLFCTTSLTEGVNTSAKNVVLYDNKIGKGDTLKSLDRKNIEGRAGRFMRHFIGRVFYLDEIEENEEETNVEIDSLDNNNPSIESIIQTDNEDLSADKVAKKELVKNKLNRLNIPFSLVKQHKFVNIEGQIRLIKTLRSEDLSKYYFSTNPPEKETNKYILSMVYDYLFTKNNKGKRFNNDVGKSILIGLTNYYLYKTPSFKMLLNSDTVQRVSEKENTRIRYVFEIVSKYFEFVWPRYLKVFESLYNFVADELGKPQINLDMVITTLEYGTTKPHEILLKDAGIPNEIIKKISNHFSGCETFEEILQRKSKRTQLIASNIHPIEMKILHKYI